ncbi:MAG: hypothetical protein K9J79_12495 [Desulfobacteraceae bacterium]|nr:hypothetical protein [Desulfobacteraceae bacterium]
MDKELLYLKLPIFLQNLACSIEGKRIQKNRYGGAFNEILQEYESRSYWDNDQVARFRGERLRSFIGQAFKHVPYYREMAGQLGLAEKDFAGLEDLQKLPLLTKSKVQDEYSRFLSGAITQNHCITSHTSGTTGGGLRFSVTKRAIQEQWAVWWRYRRWHGIDFNTWCGYFGGRSVVPLDQKKPPYWRYNRPGRQILYSGYHMNMENMGAYVDHLRKKRPPWLHGYPSLLTLLGSFLLDKKESLGYQVKWITIGAENLLPNQADIMERAFGVRPRQHYGLAEGVANISECPIGNLHVDEDFAAVEFIPNPEGLGYKLIGTNFTNPATPLVRYDTEDLVELEEGSCPCGRPGRIVKNIDGRKEDYVTLKDGTRIGRMDHVFKDLINIREAQIYQSVPGSIQVRIVKNSSYNKADEKQLYQELVKRVGSDTNIEFLYVEKLERSNTGKLRFVLSEISEGKL